MRNRSTVQVVLACALALSLPSPIEGWADETHPQDREPLHTEQTQSRRDAAAAAARIARQRNGGGRVLSVQRRGEHYRVKVIKDGEVRVHSVQVD